MNESKISIKRYEQAADPRVSLGGIQWEKKWDVCVQCDSREEAEALRAALAQPEHWSDCAVYNEPAYPKGECDCKQKKEWVGLTDKEMFDCLVQTDYAAVRLPLGLKLFAEFIEAKLKEKNAA